MKKLAINVLFSRMHNLEQTTWYQCPFITNVCIVRSHYNNLIPITIVSLLSSWKVNFSLLLLGFCIHYCVRLSVRPQSPSPIAPKLWHNILYAYRSIVIVFKLGANFWTLKYWGKRENKNFHQKEVEVKCHPVADGPENLHFVGHSDSFYLDLFPKFPAGTRVRTSQIEGYHRIHQRAPC